MARGGVKHPDRSIHRINFGEDARLALPIKQCLCLCDVFANGGRADAVIPEVVYLISGEAVVADKHRTWTDCYKVRVTVSDRQIVGYSTIAG